MVEGGDERGSDGQDTACGIFGTETLVPEGTEGYQRDISLSRCSMPWLDPFLIGQSRGIRRNIRNVGKL